MRDDNAKPPGRRLVIVVACLALMGAIGGYRLAEFTAAPVAAPAGFVSWAAHPEPAEVGPLQLAESGGGAFSNADLEGRWSLVFLGYTRCPDVCPNTLYDLDLLLRAYGPEDPSGPWQVVFISVDPERDTPAALSEYVGRFNPGFRAVTGSHEELAGLARQLGLAYRPSRSANGAGDYEVLHSASVVVIDPDRRIRGAFAPPHDPALMAETLRGLSGS